jgi:hypothetical protein
MRVMVTGSRDWTDIQTVHDALAAKSPTLVINGRCPTGADQYAHEWCEMTGVPEDPHPADWNQFGKRAGYLRNAEMVALRPDVVLAFPRPGSRGTNMTIDLAREAGIPVEIFEETQ